MDKQKQIEEMAYVIYKYGQTYDDCVEGAEHNLAKHLVNAGYRKIPENAVVIDKNENPCLSCPVPEDIQRNVDCSTICGAVRLGIDWQNQCKVLVKENKQLTKALAEKGKETAEKFAERVKNVISNEWTVSSSVQEKLFNEIDEIYKEITEKQ